MKYLIDKISECYEKTEILFDVIESAVASGHNYKQIRDSLEYQIHDTRVNKDNSMPMWIGSGISSAKELIMNPYNLLNTILLETKSDVAIKGLSKKLKQLAKKNV